MRIGKAFFLMKALAPLCAIMAVLLVTSAVLAAVIFVKLPNPTVMPTDYANGVAFSHDSTYMAVAESASPFVIIYKRSGDSFTKLDNPTDLPTGAAFSVAFSHDSSYMVVGHLNSPYITIYKRSGDSFTKLDNPTDLPTGTGLGVAFSHDSSYMAVAHESSPYITIYSRSGDIFTKLTNPVDLPTGSGKGVAFNHDSTYLAVAHNTTPYVTIYSRSVDTFTKLANPVDLPAGAATGVDFNHDSTYLAVTHNITPYVTIYSRSGDSFTKLANPTTLPTSTAYCVAFSHDSTYMAVGHSNSPFVTIYSRSGDIFTKMTNPSDLPVNRVLGVAFSHDSTYMGCSLRDPFLAIYKVGDFATYSVTYNTNSATSGTAPAGQTKVQDISLTLRTNTGSLAKTGYNFSGWNTAADGTGTDYAEGASYTANAAVTLYSKWTAAMYTVTFDKQSGTGGSNDVSATYGAAMPAATAPTRAGYTFGGYYTAAGGAGTQYYTAAMASARNWDIDAPTTLYAYWIAATYTVTYNGNGQTSGSTPADQTKTHDVALTLHSNTGALSKTGYTFSSWNTAANGSGTSYAEGASYTADAAATLYAKWIAVSFPPTVISCSPASGGQGQTLTVVITGTNLTGTTAVSFGIGITVSGLTVNSSTQITATIGIDANATPGARSVSVTTPDGTGTKTGGFTVIQQNQSIGTVAPTSHGAGTGSTSTTTTPTVTISNIQTQSASLSAKTVTPGTSVTVTANIINKSTVNGSKKVTLYVNGQVETAQGLTVNSGGSTQLTFNVSRSEPGDYSVYVDGVPAGSFKVELFRESDGILIFSASLVGLAFILGMVMLWRRQRAA